MGAVRHTARVVAIVVACLLVAALLAVEARYADAAGVRGGAASPAPAAAWAAGAEGPATAATAPSRRVVAAEYLSEAAALASWAGHPAARGGASARLAWDDRWLLADSFSYNHDLARACAVLSAVCNAESCWYSGAAGGRPFAERALASLGFTAIRTDSYAWRSSLLDEVGAFLTGSHEGVAYTFASKVVDAPGEGPVTLVFAGVRGSYGFEWLTNLNLGEGPDHDGYRAAKAELARALYAYVADLGADPASTRILVTGHSRGGAVANLLAAGLDDLAGTSQALAPASGVFAYTFAAPASTRAAGEGCHGNIFNVVGEGDLVPRLPLASWGYGRHGVTVTIPRDGRAASGGAAAAGAGDALGPSDGAPAAMASAFRANTGVGFDAGGARRAADALDAFEAEAAALTADDGTPPAPGELASALGALAALDPAAVLASHYPDAYIAWLQSLDEADLAFAA